MAFKDIELHYTNSHNAGMEDSNMPPTCSARFKDAEIDIEEAIRLNQFGNGGRRSLQKMRSGINTLARHESCCFQERGPICSKVCKQKSAQIRRRACGIDIN